MEYTLELDNRQALAAQKKSQDLPYFIFLSCSRIFFLLQVFSKKLLDF